jgi:hypothetical protein
MCLELPASRHSVLRLRKEFQETPPLLTGVVNAASNTHSIYSTAVFCKHCALTPAHATNVFKRYTKSPLTPVGGYDECLPRILPHISLTFPQRLESRSCTSLTCIRLKNRHKRSTKIQRQVMSSDVVVTWKSEGARGDKISPLIFFLPKMFFVFRVETQIKKNWG